MMNGSANGWARSGARVTTGGSRQYGRQQIRQRGELQGHVTVEGKAGVMTGYGVGRASQISRQRRIGHGMSMGHVGGQDARQRAGAEMSAGWHLNHANKSKCGNMPQAA